MIGSSEEAPTTPRRAVRVLLVYPNEKGMGTVPPAIALFSTLLKDQGHTVKLFDTTFYSFDDDIALTDPDEKRYRSLERNPLDRSEVPKWNKYRVKISRPAIQDFEALVEEYQPEVVAVSCTETTFLRGLRFVQAIRDLNIPNLFGGVFPTFAPDLVMAFPEVTAACVGEGEYAIVEFVARVANGRPLHDIAGLWVRQGDKVFKNPARKPVDINANPVITDVGLFGENRFYRPLGTKVRRLLPVETHRGCPYACSFCNSPAQNVMFGAGFFRKKRIDLVREEIEHHISRWDIDYVYFWADTFLAWSNREFDEFIEMYSDVKMPFWCQTRIETITEEKMTKLLDVGLDKITFGLEHGNEKFRREVVRRDYSNELAIEKIAIACDLGINFSINNIIGFPDETRELAFDTIELNRSLNSTSMSVSILTPFHGTEIREYAEKKGYIDHSVICSQSNADDSLLDMPCWDKADITRLRETFALYVRFPKERWPEIERAETDPALLDTLREEYIRTFYSDSTALIADDIH